MSIETVCGTTFQHINNSTAIAALKKNVADDNYSLKSKTTKCLKVIMPTKTFVCENNVACAVIACFSSICDF